MENEEQVIYLADWLDKTMGNQKRFRYKMPSFKYAFVLGFIAVNALSIGVNIYYSLEWFNVIFYFILLNVFGISYTLTYKLIRSCIVRKRETRYVFISLVKKRYINEVGITREYFIFIFNCFSMFIVLVWLCYKIYAFGWLQVFNPQVHGAQLFFGLVAIAFSWLGETLAITSKLLNIVSVGNYNIKAI